MWLVFDGRSVGWVVGFGEDDGRGIGFGFGYRHGRGDIVQGITQAGVLPGAGSRILLLRSLR